MKYLRVKVIPQSSENEWVETLEDGTLKIRIAAPAEKGKANAELLKFIAKLMKVPKDSVEIVSGKSERLKLIKIKHDIDLSLLEKGLPFE